MSIMKRDVEVKAKGLLIVLSFLFLAGLTVVLTYSAGDQGDSEMTGNSHTELRVVK